MPQEARPKFGDRRDVAPGALQVLEQRPSIRVRRVSTARNTGIRFNVSERKLRRDTPILIRNDEDVPVSYDVEYDGELHTFADCLQLLIASPELLIRTSHLLLMLEKSMVQEDNSSGKAVVFGSFG